ncbi:MAG: DUF481 domain-containing protein [Methanococcaceae archaeon]
MKKYIMTALLFISGSLNLLMAQTTEKKPSPQWWVNSSLNDTVDQYLFHVEGQYSYTKMSGAIEGEMQSGGARITVRKNIFTNHTDYMIDKMNLMIPSFGMKYNSEAHAFTDYLDVDITTLLYSEAGVIWERDNSLLIKNRYSFYAGAGLNGLISQKHYLKVLAALGRISQDYTIPVDNINVVKGAYSAFYLRQNYKYVMNQSLSLIEQAYYLTDMNHSNRYRMSVSVNLNIGIIEPVSLMLGYNYKYDKESELLGAVGKNITQTIGVNISL